MENPETRTQQINSITNNTFKKGSRILFTGYYFNEFHGSVMHICEIGKYLKTLGCDIYVASIIVDKKIKKHLDKLDIHLYYLPKLPLDIKYDIVWNYHFPFLPYLIHKGLKYDKIICGCLSGFLTPLEQPNIFLKDNHNIPIYVNSEETKVNLKKEYPFLKNNIEVFINSVPDNFLKYKKTSLSDNPKNIAIVSNHIPKELYRSLPIFKKLKINVDIYGEKNNILITPQILQNYDVIITIGKTVQYGLFLGIPVYNYDHFGGIGYINLENINKEEFYNFSGRSCNRQIAEDIIVKEITENYETTKNQMEEIQKIAEERYLLSTNISKLLIKINHSEPTKLILTDENKLILEHEYTLVKDFLSQRNKYLKLINLYKKNEGLLLLQFNHFILKILTVLIFWNKNIADLKFVYKCLIKQCIQNK